ncbi:MAG: hypothetical protein K5682_00705 [Lachnospiraceae bacterium]|nr:hypothetical protein [Lachnospiraceae bacterium]
MIAFIKKQKLNLLLLLVIALIACCFIREKEGYHMDELLSFELANADFTPWIVPTQPEGRLEKFLREQVYGDSFFETCGNFFGVVGDVLTNGGNAVIFQTVADVYEEPVWITRQQFTDYITVNGQDAFHYPSVYFNVKDDNHPPLHFMMIHTMSSIFRRQVNPWMGCVINLLFVLGSCFLMIRMGERFFGSESLGRGMAILYALSLGGMSTILLIRMYAMLTFWCVAALYLHLEKWKGSLWKTHNKLLIFVTVCGFLTQYFFLLIMLPLFAVTLVMLLRERKKEGNDPKNPLYYLRTMVLSGIWGLILYPFAIDDVLNSGRGQESLENLTGGFSGTLERARQFFAIWCEEIFGNVGGIPIILILLLLAVWILVTRRNRGEGSGQRTGTVPACETEKDAVKCLWFLGVPLIFYILVVTRIAPFYEDRYMMPAYAFAAMVMGYVFFRAVKKLGLKEHWFVVLCLVLTIPMLAIQTPNYLFKGYKAQQNVAETHRELPCVCVYDGLSYYRNLVEFTEYEQTLLVKTQELQQRRDDAVLDNEEEIVLMTGRGVEPEDAFAALEAYGYTNYTPLLEEGIHGDRIWLASKGRN